MTKDDSRDQEWRRLIRSRYDKELTLQLADGSLLVGLARDLNASGCFLVTELPVEVQKSLIGKTGVVLENLHGERLAIPCRIVRSTSEGMGICFTGESVE